MEEMWKSGVISCCLAIHSICLNPLLCCILRSNYAIPLRYLFEGRLHIKHDTPLATIDTNGCIGETHRTASLREEGDNMLPTDRIERYICGLSDINPLRAAYNDECGRTCWMLGE